MICYSKSVGGLWLLFTAYGTRTYPSPFRSYSPCGHLRTSTSPMAEACLFGNIDEPTFPYQLLAALLTWVPAYINGLTLHRGRNYQHERLYIVLVNTLLVFSRARTSAMFDDIDISICRDFANRLNEALRSLPETCGATHHQIEVVRRNNFSIFITCSRSPRFIWNHYLTHREVGLNLDYATLDLAIQSHNRNFWILSKLAPMFIHPSWESGEVVLIDYVTDMPVLEGFIERKKTLFNSTMARLELPYQFDSVWSDSDTIRDVEQAMRSETPPSRDWWESNYISINPLPYIMSFCSRVSQFETYWAVLQEVYRFSEHQSRAITNPRPIEYSDEVENLFVDVHKALQSNSRQSSSTNDSHSASNDTPLLNAVLLSPEDLLEKVTTVAECLVIDIGTLRLQVQDDHEPVRRSDLSCFLQMVIEWCKVHTLERWKTRLPLVHSTSQRWPTVGDKRWGHDPPGQKRFWAHVTDFWFSRNVF